MKRTIFLMVVVVVAVVASVMFVGCRPAAAPAPAGPYIPGAIPNPEQSVLLTAKDILDLQGLIDHGQMDPNAPLNPLGANFLTKPDGTPYTIGVTHCLIGNEWTVNCHGVFGSLINRTGGHYIAHDASMDPANQVAWVEDMIAGKRADVLVIHAIEESGMIPSVKKAIAANIPCFCFDFVIVKEQVTVSNVYHDFDGVAGSNVLGKEFVQIAESTGKPLNILEIWGDRGNESSCSRHVGLHSELDKCPLITVTESVDSKWWDEAAASIVIDNFAAHPELNAIFEHGGSGAGPVEGLRSVGRLFPIGDPNHVTICTNDEGTAMLNYVQKGYIDAFGTHQSWDLASGTFYQICNSVVLGKPVKWDAWIPMVAVTYDNWDSLQIFKVSPGWPWMPQGEWDKWPFMDLTECGIETPTPKA